MKGVPNQARAQPTTDSTAQDERTPLAQLVRQFVDVSATSLLTLWARALESQSARPILHDPAAVAITEQLRPILADFDDPFFRQLVEDDLPQALLIYIALRARRFDAYARDFVRRFSGSHAGINTVAGNSTVIVNLGCGLDTRFARLNDGHMRLVELDLPPVIDLKRRLVPTIHARHTLLAGSVLDFAWMDALDRHDNARFLFLAEGLLMYLPEEEVKRLVITLAERFPGSELVAEVFNASWLRPLLRDWVASKLRRRFHFGESAMFEFGIRDSRSLEAWSPRLEWVDDWSYLDEHERKLGLYHWLRHIRAIRQIQWVVHYRLG